MASLSTFDFFLNCKELQDLEILDRSADVKLSIPLVYDYVCESGSKLW